MSEPIFTLEETFQYAVLTFKAGNFAEAEQLCRQILSARPDFFNALHLLAIAQASQGRHEAAVESYDRALALRPDDAATLNNRGNSLRLLRCYDEALAGYDRGLAARPDDADLLNNRGVTLRELGRLDEALDSYDRALAVRPGAPDALNNRGNALLELRRYEEALSNYRQALAARPGDGEILNNLGTALVALRRFDQALVHYDRMLMLRPADAEMLNSRGNALSELGRHDEALASYDRALAARPGDADFLYNRGNALQALGRQEEALASYDRALAARPDYADALNNRGITLHDLQRLDGALASYRQSLAIKPDNPDASYNSATTLTQLGRFDEARAAIDAALRAVPGNVDYYFALIELKRFAADDPHLAAMEDLARNVAALTPENQSKLHFALSKALADCGQHERSFQHLLQGNALKRRQISYDEPVTLDYIARVRAAFTVEVFRAGRGLGDPSEAPVFIVGMPRSGTTLIEQILASHPRVFGAGELNTLNRVVTGIAGPSPEAAAALQAEPLRRLGAAYLDRVLPLAPAADRITDKMPSNFLHVGLIHLALPHAKIIHARRDPVDTAMSIFSKLFRGDQPFAYDLAELGRFTRAYQGLMDHWRRVMPEGVMLEVQYEEVVDDLEGQARRIVAHCGLGWDDACLAFHETDRAVQTASSVQVRQPIYRTSIGRWQPYRAQLGPLLEALGIES